MNQDELEAVRGLTIYASMGACVLEILKRSEELYNAVTNPNTDEDELEVKIILKKEIMFHIAKGVEKITNKQNLAMPECKVSHGEILEHFLGFLLLMAIRSICSDSEKAINDVKSLMVEAYNLVKPKTA